MLSPRTLALVFAITVAPATALAGEEVPFDSLPAPVKATVQREVKNGQILEIERETKQGKLLYEIDFRDANAVKWEIDVAPDGTLLSREQD